MSLMKRLMAAKMKQPVTLSLKGVDVGAMKLKLTPGAVTAVREPLPPMEWQGYNQGPTFSDTPLVPTSAPGVLTFRGSCKAINADTGRCCALLANHAGAHRHGSTSFVRVAKPGATSFSRRDALDAAASSSHSSAFTTPQE